MGTPDRPRPPALGPVPLARGARGAVVAPHHLATAAGLRMLDEGGSAVDAAIAANAVLAVVAPNMCGVGGDAFWLVWDEGAGEQVAINGSGRAPSGADPAALRARGLTRIPLRGPLGISVPGAVRSWSDAHRRWGRLPRERVIAPAIEHAAAGFAVWGGLAASIERTAASLGDAPWAAGFHRVYRPHGRPWRPGEVLGLPALATTLSALARDGFDALYDGPLGERQARFLAEAGAPFVLADVRDHRSEWGAPIATTYRGVRVTTHPPNSVGVVALETLRVLETFDPPPADAFGPGGWRDARWVHAGIEASKLALADRDRWVADPAVRDVPVGRLLGHEHVAGLAGRIDPRRADRDPTPVVTLVGGTAYLAAVDADGNAVSLIQSNAAGFGSGVVDPETGISYQDRGSSFRLEPDHPNVLTPGKRTTHSLMPGMLFRAGERRPWVVAGSMGGDIQPQVHVQLVSALVDAGADVATAVAAARWFVEPEGAGGPPLHVGLDAHAADGLAEALEALGHAVHRQEPFASHSHCHAIELVDGGPASGGSLAAATDPRSPGLPAVR